MSIVRNFILYLQSDLYNCKITSLQTNMYIYFNYMQKFISKKEFDTQVKQRNALLYPMYREAVETRQGAAWLRKIAPQVGLDVHSLRNVLMMYGKTLNDSKTNKK